MSDDQPKTIPELVALWRAHATLNDKHNMISGIGETYRQCASELEAAGIKEVNQQANPLVQEIATYEKLKPWMLAHFKDRWAIIKGDSFYGSHHSWEAALSDAYAILGNTGFLIRKVSEKEEIVYL